MIGFVDTVPTVEPHHGGLLVTLASGEGKVQLHLTRHVGAVLGRRLAAATAVLFGAETEPTPISRRKRR